jgi:hypothetical protein
LHFFNSDGTIEPAEKYPEAAELLIRSNLKWLGAASLIKFLKPHFYHLDWSSFVPIVTVMDLETLKTLPMEFWDSISQKDIVMVITNMGDQPSQLSFIKYLGSIGFDTKKFCLYSSLGGECFGPSEGAILEIEDSMFVIHTFGGCHTIRHQAWKKIQLHTKYFEESELVDTASPLYLYSDQT